MQDPQYMGSGLLQAATGRVEAVGIYGTELYSPAMQGVRDRYSALFSPAKTPCSCSCGSVTFWGCHILRCLVP